MFANGALIFTDLTVLVLGLIALLNNSRGRANRFFFGYCLSTSFWITANIIVNFSTTSDGALFWSRATMYGAALLVYFFFLFTLNFPKTRIRRPLEILSFLPVLAFLVLTPTSFNVVSSGPHGDNLVAGPLYTALLLYFPAYTIAGLINLRRSLKQETGIAKEQLRYVYAGVLFSFFPGFVVNGVFLSINIPTYAAIGPLATLIFVAAVAYAMIRHHLLNIRFVVARSIMYTLLLATMAAIYAVATFALSSLLFPDQKTSVSHEALNVLLAVVLAFGFQPLRRFFQRITDRIFYRDRYDSQEVLNRFTGILVSELHLETILKRAIKEMCDSLHIQFGQIIVFNADRVYKIEHYGPLPKRLMVAPELKRLSKHMLIADELEGGERKQLLETHGVRVSLMLSTREDFVGYILLGDKLSGDIYSTQDVELLEIIRGELAVAIQNAKSYTEIQDFNVTLQARVDHATNRLRVANRHLQELDKAKDEFISMASHQLRTPLTTIKGYLSMMLEGDVGKVPENQQQFIRYAFDSSERMVNLISDLLNVSRMSAGRFLIQTKPTDMVQMIEEEVRQLTPHARAKNIGLVFDAPGDPLPLIEIDGNKTRQVIMNFIDNAIYYTTKGEVRVTLEQTGAHVRLTVKDTGIGVPDDAKKKLFTKFFRAGNAQTLRPDGTGLGLYLAKRVIEDQGGTIIFESAEGKGSTFGFELPLKPPPAPHKEKDKEKELVHA
jgi:signal transduction histidine kinase